MPSQKYLTDILEAFSKAEDQMAAQQKLLQEQRKQIEAQTAYIQKQLEVEILKLDNRQVQPAYDHLPQVPQICLFTKYTTSKS